MYIIVQGVGVYPLKKVINISKDFIVNYDSTVRGKCVPVIVEGDSYRAYYDNAFSISDKLSDSKAVYYFICTSKELSDMKIVKFSCLYSDKDMGVFDEAKAIQDYLSMFGLNQVTASVALGISQSTISNKMRLLRLDDTLKNFCVDNNFTERHIRALLSVGINRRKDVAQKIVQDSMNVEETYSYVRSLKQKYSMMW